MSAPAFDGRMPSQSRNHSDALAGAGPCSGTLVLARELAMRRMLAAGTMLLVTLGVAIGDEFNAIIKKIDGDKVTLVKAKKGKKAKAAPGEEMVLTAAENLKVIKGNYSQD